MTAHEIHETMKNYIPFWDYDENEINDAENVAYIQKLIDTGLLKLYDVMKADADIMTDYDGDETGLLYDLLCAGETVINEYKTTYLPEAMPA